LPSQELIDRWLKIVDTFFDPKVPATGPATQDLKLDQAILEEKKEAMTSS